MTRYHVTARVEIETGETLVARGPEAAVESHQEAIEEVAAAIGADVSEFEVQEVDANDGASNGGD